MCHWENLPPSERCPGDCPERREIRARNSKLGNNQKRRTSFLVNLRDSRSVFCPYFLFSGCRFRRPYPPRRFRRPPTLGFRRPSPLTRGGTAGSPGGGGSPQAQRCVPHPGVGGTGVKTGGGGGPKGRTRPAARRAEPLSERKGRGKLRGFGFHFWAKKSKIFRPFGPVLDHPTF